MNKKLKNYEVLVKALKNFSLVNLDINVLNKRGKNVFKKIKKAEANKAKILYDPYLGFIEENRKPFTLSTSYEAKSWDGTLEYSTDTNNWSEWGGSEISSSSDGKLYLRGMGNSRISTRHDGRVNSFLLTNGKRIQCLGNIETLLDYKTVEAGSHPAMANACYRSMFDEGTPLTKAPDLPAITLTENCYGGMFYGCSSLTEAPELPATVLTEACYQDMFAECASLTQASELPATTLVNDCYGGMFYNCKSLTTAPELPATILADRCYDVMFFGCTSLTGTIHCPASTANDSNRLDATAQIPTGTATVVYDL